MKNLFDYDGSLNRVLTKVMYIVSLNLLFLACCIPVITAGASATAMYTVMMRFLQDDEPDIIRTFLGAFRKNFKKSTVLWLIMLTVAGTLGMNYYLIYHIEGTGVELIRIFLNLILAIWIGFGVYIFPVMAYYENTISGYTEFTFRIALGQLPYTILLILLQVLPLFVLLYLAQFLTGAVLLLLCCGFSLPAYFSGRLLIRLFRSCEEKRYGTKTER